MTSEKAWMIATFVFAAGFFILLGNFMAMKGGTAVMPKVDPSVPKQVAPSAPSAPEIVELGDVSGYVRGPEDAEITIVEWSDFECPFCGRAVPSIDQVMKDYEGRVKLIFKHFPLPFHPNAKPASMAAECAGDQGKFWEYHDKLFANQQALTGANLKQYAVDLGLDADAFNECLDSGKHGAKVDADMAAGSAAGVSGTPTFFINGRKLVGAQPFAAFKQVIDSI